MAKKDTNFRKAIISVQERLAITFRFLASGDLYAVGMFAFCANGDESWYAKTSTLNSKGNALLLRSG